MREELLERIGDVVRRVLGTGCEVSFKKVEKNNGVELQSISIKESEEMVAPVIYIDEMLQKIEAGERELQDVVKEIIDIHNRNKNMGNFRELISNLSKERILENVTCKLVNRAANKKLLMNVPHSNVLDLAVLYRLTIYENDYGNYSISVNCALCKKYGISMEELETAAIENTRKRGFKVQTITDAVGELGGMPESMICEMSQQIYALTSDTILDGACVMLYPEYFEEIAERMNSDLYILPSSIHEVIVVPVLMRDVNLLSETVREINLVELNPEEFLSNSVYRYSREEGKISIETCYHECIITEAKKGCEYH